MTTRKVREGLTVRVYPLGAEPGDDLRATTTAAQRLEMVAELSRRMWELAGRPVPRYARADLPCRVVPLA